MSSNSSVRGKYAAYLEQSGPACCGLSHGFTEWFDSEDELIRHININYPGADWPSSTDDAPTGEQNSEDENNRSDTSVGSEPPSADILETAPETGGASDTINAPLDMSVGLNADVGADAADGEDDEDEDEDDEEDEDEEPEEDDVSISWAGTFEDLCESSQYQAQVVRVRFFEDLRVGHPDKKVEFSYDDNVPTPPVPGHLHDLFDKWLASGEMAFC